MPIHNGSGYQTNYTFLPDNSLIIVYIHYHGNVSD